MTAATTTTTAATTMTVSTTMTAASTTEATSVTTTVTSTAATKASTKAPTATDPFEDDWIDIREQVGAYWWMIKLVISEIGLTQFTNCLFNVIHVQMSKENLSEKVFAAINNFSNKVSRYSSLRQ